MFNPRQQILLISGFTVILVFFLGQLGGIDGGASLLWGLVVGFVAYRLQRQNLIVAGARKTSQGKSDPGRTVKAPPLPAEPAKETEKLPEVEEASQPAALSAPRGGKPDDLKRIAGIGPKLERVLNDMGYFHFDQIAAWSASDVAWMDANLPGASGRATRDEWVSQARTLLSP